MPGAVEVGPTTRTTLAVTAVCVSAFLGGALWIERSLSDVSKGQTQMESRLELISYRLGKIEAQDNSYVPMTAFRAWAEGLEKRNPQISVPTVQ